MASVSTNINGGSLSKNVHLSSNDRNLMFHYYMTLNKYFNNQGDSEDVDRSMSSRAIKARKRLLNLSTYQFFELTTDVNDEVERRMNTALNGEYLLPKDNLHLKRNQARQKLANLSQKRFLDLVDDLSFEIRRRQYDLDPQFDAPYEEEEENIFHQVNEVAPNSNIITKPSNLESSTTATDLANEDDQNGKSLTNKPSVQEVNVKTATLDWSDDEDVVHHQTIYSPQINNKFSNDDFDLPEGFQKRSLQVTTNAHADVSTENKTNNVATNNMHANGVSKKRSSVQEDLSLLQHDLAMQATNSSIINKDQEKKLQAVIDDMSNKHSSLLAKNFSINEEHSSLIEKHANLTEEHSSLLAKNLHLNKENLKLQEEKNNLAAENDKLSNELKTNEDTLSELKSKFEVAQKSSASKEHRTKDFTSMLSKVENLSIENETLKQKIMDLEIKDQLLDTVKDIQTNLFEETDISSFVKANSYENGIIPITYINDFQKSVHAFYAKLQIYKQKQNNKDLFLEATKVCDIIAHIVKVVEYKDGNQLYIENCILANTTSTHLLTTLRYQSKFADIFPKIIIQNALLEVVGGIYQLIYKAGCQLNQNNNILNNDVQHNGEISMKHPKINLSSSSLGSLEGKDEDTNLLTVKEEESQVRPLKITQRLSSMPQFDYIDGSGNTNQAQAQNGSARKHSNTGLFSNMLLTPTSSKAENNPFNSGNNKNIKKLSLPLKDESIINKNVTVTTPKKETRSSSVLGAENTSRISNGGELKTTPVKSHGILSRVKAFEESISSTESSPEGNKNSEFSNQDIKVLPKKPSTSSIEISKLQKRNSLQSIEERATTFGDIKNNHSNGVEGKHVKEEEINYDESTDETEKGYVFSEEDKDLNNLLQYLESESIEVISTIQSLLTSIKNPNATIIDLNNESRRIMEVVNKVCTNTLTSIEENQDLKTIGEYIITSLQDCERRMHSLIETDTGSEYPDKSFKQRLAGIAFDIAKNVKKLVKIVEELSLKKEIAHLDNQLL
ncbi:hypothetical protein QEN19_001713 [Hanseniaspora menglaensis]